MTHGKQVLTPANPKPSLILRCPVCGAKTDQWAHCPRKK